MRYAVGTGRCGTKSLAVLEGGLHEPEPSIRSAAQSYIKTREYTGYLMDALKIRSRLKTPLISDCSQSLVINLIREVDEDARFIWLIREPRSCIRSFLNRGTFGIYWEKVNPADRFLGVCNMYAEVNKRIKSTIGDCELMKTECLPIKENTGRQIDTIWDEDVFRSVVLPVYEDICG